MEDLVFSLCCFFDWEERLLSWDLLLSCDLSFLPRVGMSITGEEVGRVGVSFAISLLPSLVASRVCRSFLDRSFLGSVKVGEALEKR